MNSHKTFSTLWSSLELCLGLFGVGKMTVNDLNSSISAIIPYTTMVLMLARAMTVKKCIDDRFCKNNLEEE